MEITRPKSIPKKIFVLIIAKISNAFESFNAKICVIVIIDTRKITSASIENKPEADVIIINQKENPAVTASALNLGEDNSILNWINEYH